jgi:hypothetical protein
MRDAARDDGGLAGSRSGHDQKGALIVLDRFPLFGVQSFELGGGVGGKVDRAHSEEL